jgi:hypothetical protein
MKRIYIAFQNVVFFGNFVKIGITEDDLIMKITAYDWLELVESETDTEVLSVINKVYIRYIFKAPFYVKPFIKIRFNYLFSIAVKEIKDLIEEINGSYNVDVAKQTIPNDAIDRYWYLKYWADKNSIPVNYNEHREEERDKFNLYTILMNILADKQSIFYTYGSSKTN